MSAPSLGTQYRELFIDPISHEMMTDPYIAPCGHTFEKDQIDGWVAHCVQNGRAAACPLDRSPLENLVPNRLIREALDILRNPQNQDAHVIEDLADEEQVQLREAERVVEAQREADAQAGIPDRLAEPTTFQKMKDFYRNIYRCGR